VTDDWLVDSGTDLREVPLSALEHYAYCRRQTALIHVEGVWSENVETVRGDLSHTTVDMPGIQHRRGLTIVRSLPVWSSIYGLRGICDIVEFEKGTATPVEYKVGRHKVGGPAELQLGGQALCLLEAGFDVPTGYIYSVAERRRHAISIDADLLDEVVAVPRLRPYGSCSPLQTFRPHATTAAAGDAPYARIACPN
jgi:CRISPR-associated exonuclease Cas4